MLQMMILLGPIMYPHPTMNEEEKVSACRTLEYHRLSQEACEHVVMNDQLPLKITT